LGQRGNLTEIFYFCEQKKTLYVEKQFIEKEEDVVKIHEK